MRTVRVKICGITRPADAVAAETAGADAIGLMFVPESPRLIDIPRARELADAVGPLLLRVGVFRDAPLQQVLETAEDLRLAAVQLHGRESTAYVEAVRRKYPVIRALSFDGAMQRSELESIAAEGVLLDGRHPGGGVAFDWNDASTMAALPRMILAGGLNPRNVAAGIRQLRPYGVDVSSGVETEPGIKDHELMREFVAAARSAFVTAQ